MAPLITADEYLQVPGSPDLPLATPACRLTDLGELSSAAQLVGENLRMPLAHGRRRYRRYRDQLEFALPGIVNGAVDFDGTPIADARQGLRDHLLFLGSALGQASATTDSAVLTLWHQFDDTEFEAMGQWAGPYVGRRLGPYVRAVSFELVIPSGQWDEAT